MQQDDLIGKTLGNYRIIVPLGQGGMARVYKAYQENLDREVAVKVLPPWYAADRSFIERFNLEARLVARLSHPNIVTVHDANEQDGHLYIVMQLVDGGTLKHRIDELHRIGRAMNLAEAVPIFSQLASALMYAHKQGIIHRDVKPVNVLMDRSGRPILSDFGIAKVLASTHMNLTRPGAGVGTPDYMSPEQCQGGEVDGRADIYALGIMLFEALTGCTPFRGDSYPALAHSHIYEPPPRPRSLNPSISPTVERVILTALMKQPQQRFQHACDMADALIQALAKNTPTPTAHNYYTPSGGENSPFIERRPRSQESYLLALYPCRYCQHGNKPQMRFCTRCGNSMNQCTNCGNHNFANNRFCTRCGEPRST
jgi:serine/threonine-protein kinase